MQRDRLRIVFLGTAAFGIPALEALLHSHHEVVGVVTAPDKPAGRGLRPSISPIKQVALQHAIPLLQPVKLKDPEFLRELEALRPDLQVVVAFRMLPEVVWKLPPLGTINIHASLLPDYRGAAPIQWAIINGEQETGITIFRLNQDIDTGDILLQEKTAIRPGETAGELHDRLQIMGAELLLQAIEGLQQQNLHPIPQHTLIKPGQIIHTAPKIQKEDARIDWHQPAQRIVQLILGMNPSPVAWTMLNQKIFRIYRAHVVNEIPHVSPGNYVTDHKTMFRFAAQDAWVELDEVQLEGKKRLPVHEFLKGFRD
ncbi:MAG: methionyl-tRNA formyltransferase [Thermoflavifilum sp.]|nr:methionyl-tRNA formyltransferase [Thermoflavifilum sp.]